MQLTIISTPTGYRLIPDPENDPIFYAMAIKVIADYMIEHDDLGENSLGNGEELVRSLPYKALPNENLG